MKKQLAIINTFENPIPPEKYARFEANFGKMRDSIQWTYFHYLKLDDPTIYTRIMAMDGIIISGSYFSISESFVQIQFKNTLQCIREFSRPILGVCFGHQMIGVAFGFTVDYLEPELYDEEFEVPLKIEISPKFRLFSGKSLFTWQSHHQEIKYTPEIEKEFDILGSSSVTRIQILQHKTRPLYGLQFHPETPEDPPCFQDGQIILETFLSLL